jgi:hypothetical protein
LKSQNKQYAVGMVFMPKVPTKSFFAKPLWSIYKIKIRNFRMETSWRIKFRVK